MTDFIKYKNKTLRVVYVDPSLNTGPNDGDSISGALWNLPALATSLSGSAAYVIRRTTTPAIIRKGNCPNNDVLLIGMPATSGQLFYKDLSQTAKTAWASDVTPTATVYISGYAPNTPLRFGMSTAYGGYGLFNIDFKETEVSNQKYGLVDIYGGSTTIENCTFSISGYPLSGYFGHSLTEWTGLHMSNAEGLTVNNIESICYGYGDSYSSASSYQIAACLFIENGGSNCSVTNSVFRITTGTSYSGRSFGIRSRGDITSGEFKNLKFYNDGPYSGNQPKVSYMKFDTISNGCVFENISGWGGYTNENPNVNKGIEILYGTSIASSPDAYKRKSGHIFRNIYFYDGANLNAAFTGLQLGDRFNDCTFDNIQIIAPSASNYEGYYGMYIGDYSTHNTFNNMYIDYGSAQTHVINNNNNCYSLYFGGASANQKFGKNFISNSTFKCCKIGIYGASTPLDITNTSITGSLQVFGDSIDIVKLEAPNKGNRYASNPELLYHFGGVTDDSNILATNTVFKIKELINNSGVGYTLNYGTAKVSIENMSSAGTSNTITGLIQSENSGAIYLNNYPQKDYWLAQNTWHKFDTSIVQFVTTANISSGYSLAYTYLTNTGWPSTNSPAEQAITIPPSPFKGSEVVSTQALQTPNQYNAVLYFATKYASLVTSSELWFELEIPNGTSGTDTKFISSRSIKDGIVVDTGLTIWSGETLLDIYKITLPFILERQESVYSRIYWNKSMPGGTAKAFIAPRIIIEG